MQDDSPFNQEEFQKETDDQESEESEIEQFQQKKTTNTENDMETEGQMFVQRNINSIFPVKKKRMKWLRFDSF